MKKNIHPTYYPDCKITCACGNTFVTGSTLPEIKIEVCSACHPFYTGKQKLVDTARRVEKFEEKKAKSAKLTDRKGKKAKRAKKSAKRSSKEVVVKMKPEDLKKPSSAKAMAGEKSDKK